MATQTPNTWDKIRTEWPQLVADFDIDPRKAALLVIDMQKFNVQPGGDLIEGIVREFPPFGEYYFPRAKDVVIPNIRRLLDFFREHGLRIIYSRVEPLLEDGADMPPVLRGTGRIHKKELEIVDELKPQGEEIVLGKNSYSAFTSSNIDQVLRNLGITDLVITGATSDGCVETTARDAADRGYNCFIVEDATVTLAESLQQAAMDTFVLMFGKVGSTEQLIDDLKPRV